MVADDHPLFLDGLVAVINLLPGYKVTGQAHNGKDLLQAVRKNPPQVVITDLRMPEMDGLQVVRQVKQDFPDIKVLVLTVDDEDREVLKVLREGADGYLLKSTGREGLEKALALVMEGEKYYSPEVSSQLIHHLIHEGVSKPRKPVSPSSAVPGANFEDPLLTDREKEVLILIVRQEMTNDRIARELKISKRTVDTHRKNLLLKTQAANTVGLVKYALKRGLI